MGDLLAQVVAAALNRRRRCAPGARAWRDDDPDPATRAEVDALLEADDLDGLRDRFGERLQFGTAGLRGALGAGPEPDEPGARAPRHRGGGGVAARRRAATGPVVVGRDARHGSADFADDTARVLAGAGFPVLVLPRPLPTPVTAFATRHLGAVAGIMITASHNPPQDNGYKLYLGDGAQIVPPVDEEISAHIDAVGSVADLPLSGRRRSRCWTTRWSTPTSTARSALLDDGPRQVEVVYTAMHGVGAETLRAAFARAGFPPAARGARAGRSPTPTSPPSPSRTRRSPARSTSPSRWLASSGADLVLANDPDADRLGVADPGPAATAGAPSPATRSARCSPTTCCARGRYGPDDVVRHHRGVVAPAVDAGRATPGVAYGEALTGFKWVVRTPAPGQRFAVRLRGGARLLRRATSSATRTASPPRWSPRRWPPSSRARGRSLARAPRRPRPRARRPRHPPALDPGERGRLARAGHRRDGGASEPTRRRRWRGDAVARRRGPGAWPAASPCRPTSSSGRSTVPAPSSGPSGTEPKLKCYAEAVVPVEDEPVDGARRRAATIVDEVLDDVAALLGEPRAVTVADWRAAWPAMWFHQHGERRRHHRADRDGGRWWPAGRVPGRARRRRGGRGHARRRGRGRAVVAAATTTTTTTEPPTTTTTVPPTVVPPSTDLATPKGAIATYDAPDGAAIGEVGFWYGYPMTMPIVEEAARRAVAADHDAGAAERAHRLGEGRGRHPQHLAVAHGAQAQRDAGVRVQGRLRGVERAGGHRPRPHPHADRELLRGGDREARARGLRPDRAQPQRPLRGHPELAGERRRHHRVPRPLRRARS